MTIKDRIKNLCSQNGISVNKFEQELGLSRGYVSKMNVSNPGGEILIAISDYFNVTTDYLLGREPLTEDKSITDAKEAFAKARALFSNLKTAQPAYYSVKDNVVSQEEIDLIISLMNSFEEKEIKKLKEKQK